MTPNFPLGFSGRRRAQGPCNRPPSAGHIPAGPYRRPGCAEVSERLRLPGHPSRCLQPLLASPFARAHARPHPSGARLGCGVTRICTPEMWGGGGCTSGAARSHPGGGRGALTSHSPTLASDARHLYSKVVMSGASSGARFVLLANKSIFRNNPRELSTTVDAAGRERHPWAGTDAFPLSNHHLNPTQPSLCRSSTNQPPSIYQRGFTTPATRVSPHQDRGCSRHDAEQFSAMRAERSSPAILWHRTGCDTPSPSPHSQPAGCTAAKLYGRPSVSQLN